MTFYHALARVIGPLGLTFTLIIVELASGLDQQVTIATSIYRNVSTQYLLRHNCGHFDKHLTAVIESFCRIDEGA
jgi:hypothetical protein